MTAPGIMSNAALSGSPVNGKSFMNPAKGGSEGSFEKIMESTQKGSFGELTRKGTGPKKTMEVSEASKSQAKSMLAGKGKATEETKPKDASEDLTERAEAVSTLIVQIREIVCENLGISEEELSNAMDAMGLTDAELLNRNRLQELFLSVNQVEEPTEFLTNEALFDDFAGMMQAVEQTIREMELTPESVREVLQNIALSEPEEAFVVKGNVEHPDSTDMESDTKEESAEGTSMLLSKETDQTENSVKAETKESKDEGHMAKAKGDENRKEISTETDGTLKENFVEAMTRTSAQGSEEAIAAAQQVREIANQVIEQIRIVIRPEQTSMEFMLNPEQLGRVQLTVTQKEGKLTAQFMTQTQTAKEALMSQMEVLKESLQNQGLRIEAIEVYVSDFGFERDRDANQGNGSSPDRRRRRDGLRSEGTEDEAPKMEDYLNATDSNVDYSA